MLSDMVHRGPDESGVFQDENVTLGMNRLAITGINDYGYVPFRYKNLTLVFNGEIYNYKELKKILIDKYNISFSTNTDSEVLIKLWSVFETKALQMIEGMYSFSIYNSKTNLIYLIRDIAGQKPLYYFKYGKKIVFASEAKAIFKNVKNISLVDKSKLRFYEAFQHTLNDTLYSNLQQVPAAHYLKIDVNTLKIELINYWKPSFNFLDGSEDDLIDEFCFLLKKSIEEVTQTEVNYGLYLSRGIDSQTINKFHKFENTFFFDREKDWGKDFFEKLPEVVKTLDFPVGSLSSYPLYKLAESAAKKKVKVIISGEGSDELLGGYVRYLPCLKVNEVYETFPTYTTLFNKGLRNGFDVFSRLTCRNDDLEFVQSLVNEIRKDTPDLLSCMQFFDFKFILPSLLQMGDRCASHFSLENRCPFLNRGLIDFCFNLPITLKVKGFDQKYIMRKIAKKHKINIENEKTGLTIKFNDYLHRNDYNRDSYFSILNYVWLSQFRTNKKLEKSEEALYSFDSI